MGVPLLAGALLAVLLLAHARLVVTRLRVDLRIVGAAIGSDPRMTITEVLGMITTAARPLLRGITTTITTITAGTRALLLTAPPTTTLPPAIPLRTATIRPLAIRGLLDVAHRPITALARLPTTDALHAAALLNTLRPLTLPTGLLKPRTTSVAGLPPLRRWIISSDCPRRPLSCRRFLPR